VVAAVVADQVLIGNVADRRDIPHIRTMALYASEILDGSRPGPYNDQDADEYATRVFAVDSRCPRSPPA